MKRNNKINTCLTDCVAYYFQINPARVPFFIEHKDWLRRVKSFFMRRGYKVETIKYTKSLKRFIAKKGKNKLAIVSGISPRAKKKRFDHAVVYKGNTPIFDPAPSQKFLKKPEFYWAISKLSK